MIKSDDFFDRQRSWSLIKYKILDKYLSQYFPKVNQRYRTGAYVADLFAGRGRFEDGTDGSPLIIAKHAHTYEQKLGYKNKVILSEIIDEDRKILKDNLDEYIKNEIVEVIPGGAVDVGNYLLSVIPPSTPLFIFLDPFGIKGLSMKLLLQVFQRATAESTELLINFNYKALKRLAGICRNLGSGNPILNDQALLIKSIVDEALNGGWWLEIMNSGNLDDDQKLDSIMNKYLDFFRNFFRWIAVHPVTTLREKEVKYFLIFASQSQVAIELMNDVAIQARKDVLLEEIKEEYTGSLFENTDPEEFTTRTTDEDIQELSERMHKAAEWLVSNEISAGRNRDDVFFMRPQLRALFLRKYFGRFTNSEYNEAIRRLLISGKLLAENGRNRISDTIRIRIAQT